MNDKNESNINEAENDDRGGVKVRIRVRNVNFHAYITVLLQDDDSLEMQ